LDLNRLKQGAGPLPRFVRKFWQCVSIAWCGKHALKRTRSGCL